MRGDRSSTIIGAMIQDVCPPWCGFYCMSYFEEDEPEGACSCEQDQDGSGRC